ncbi:MAG: dihydroxyacetone kinase subunit L [Methanobacterium sp.]|nr:dihydroxyacetone kinase subunit L [Methanobacterium sp.]
MDKLTTKDIIRIVDIMSDIIIENEVYFCELDSPAGDGDFGMSLSKGFRKVKQEWETLSKENIGTFLKDCGMIITEYCGGASGPIWGSAFRGAANYAKGKNELELLELSEMLQSAIDGIQKRGGAKLGDKTLLDALIPAVESLKKSAKNNEDLYTSLEQSASEAVLGGEKTKEIVASKGRATYLGDRSLNHPDAGATAIGVIFTGIIEKLRK